MASQKSKRRASGASPAPRRGRSPRRRRDERAERQAQTAQRASSAAAATLGREGERPESPFGGLPVSELAILLGLIASVVGFIQGGGPALIVGLIVCALGVIEITAREHFSGYRSHTALLAAIPAVALEVGFVAAFGEPRQRAAAAGWSSCRCSRVCSGCCGSTFLTARQARVARATRAPL